MRRPKLKPFIGWNVGVGDVGEEQRGRLCISFILPRFEGTNKVSCSMPPTVSSHVKNDQLIFWVKVLPQPKNPHNNKSTHTVKQMRYRLLF